MKSKELFKEIERHLLEDEKPSLYLESLREKGELKGDFQILSDLYKVPQEAQHHPEGVVWNHMMLVLDRTAHYKEYARDKKSFMWGALLHDIGKKKTTKQRKGRWTSYEHDLVGEEEVSIFLDKLTEDYEFKSKVKELVKYHMSYFYMSRKLPFGDVEGMLKSKNLHDIVLLSLCDRLGRGELTKEREREIKVTMREFSEKLQEDLEENLDFKRFL